MCIYIYIYVMYCIYMYMAYIAYVYTSGCLFRFGFQGTGFRIVLAIPAARNLLSIFDIECFFAAKHRANPTDISMQLLQAIVSSGRQFNVEGPTFGGCSPGVFPTSN